MGIRDWNHNPTVLFLDVLGDLVRHSEVKRSLVEDVPPNDASEGGGGKQLREEERHHKDSR